MQLGISPLTIKNPRLFGYIFASILLLYFVFAAGVNILYYGGDDYRYAFGGLHEQCKNDDGFYFMLTLARPIQAYLDCLSFKYAYTLEHMRWVRIFTVAMMGVGMGLLADWLATLGLPIISAFFAASIVFMMQRYFGDSIAMGANSLPFAVVFALLGYRFLNITHESSQKYPYVLAAILILCGLLTYPAMAFIFGTLILTRILFSNFSEWQITRRRVVKEILFFGCCATVYFIYAYCNMRFHAQAAIPTQYQIEHPNFSLTEIVARISALLNIFQDGGAWLMLPDRSTHDQGMFVIYSILGAFAVTAIQLFSAKNRVRDSVEAIFLAITVFGLSSAFYLIIPNREPISSRLAFGTATACAALIIWCLMQWSKILPKIAQQSALVLALVTVFFIQANFASSAMLRNALHFGQYLGNTQEILSEYIKAGNTLQRVHFVIDQKEYPYTRFFLANAALGQIIGAGNYQIKWCSTQREVPDEKTDHQAGTEDCIKRLPKNGIAVTYSHPQESIPKTENMVVLKVKFEDPAAAVQIV